MAIGPAGRPELPRSAHVIIAIDMSRAAENGGGRYRDVAIEYPRIPSLEWIYSTARTVRDLPITAGDTVVR